MSQDGWRGCGREIHQDPVDPIQAGAGHQADIQGGASHRESVEERSVRGTQQVKLRNHWLGFAQKL